MTYCIEGKTATWEIVVGLEVHCQVISQSKLFSGASTAFGAAPNTHVSLVDAAMPGMLPVLNQHCVHQAVKTGLGLNAQIHLKSVFARKNYFYADLPQGYQISQADEPIVGEGAIEIDLQDGSSKVIGIERLHLEQDAGKSIHDQHPEYSYIDLNRSGIALMEIVSKPDIRSPEEAGAYLRKLRAIVRYLETCDGNMDEGSMRCDVNVSVRAMGEKTLGTRCEIKNVNSVRFVMQAIESEALRQVQLIESGQEVIQQTRLYDPKTSQTRAMRKKEFAHDYRYFPDPDLLPLYLEPSFVENLRKNLPELPDQKKKRFMDDYHLSAYDAGVLTADRDIAHYFESLLKGRDPKLVVSWMSNVLFADLKAQGKSLKDHPMTVERFGPLLDLISDQVLSGRLAKEVFELMVQTGKSATEIVEEKGLRQMSDAGELEEIIQGILDQNQDKVQQIKDGKDKLLGWFVGQVMKQTSGQANPNMVNKILREKISSS